jgi:mRNA-degrading endonuclease YafQ of YafQ-DinJ toxin-antitoxin module
MNLDFELKRTKPFKKKLAKILKGKHSLAKKIIKFLKLLAKDPKYPGLKSHQVNHPEHGKVWSSWVHDDLRVLWKYDEDGQIVILLLDIGDHDHIY